MEPLLWLIATVGLILACVAIGIVINTSWKLGDDVTRQMAWDQYHIDQMKKNPGRYRQALRTRANLHQAYRETISHQPVSIPSVTDRNTLR